MDSERISCADACTIASFISIFGVGDGLRILNYLHCVWYSCEIDGGSVGLHRVMSLTTTQHLALDKHSLLTASCTEFVASSRSVVSIRVS